MKNLLLGGSTPRDSTMNKLKAKVILRCSRLPPENPGQHYAIVLLCNTTDKKVLEVAPRGKGDGIVAPCF